MFNSRPSTATEYTRSGYGWEAWLAPLSWFSYFSLPDADTHVINGRHIFSNTEDWIYCYALKDTVQGASDAYGTPGAANNAWRPRMFIPGDDAYLQTMLEDLRNQPMLLMLRDPDCPYLLQFGSEHSPLFLSKISFASGDRKGWDVECAAANRFFYNLEPSLEDIFRARAAQLGYEVDEFNGTQYTNLDSIVTGGANFIMPAIAYTSGVVYGIDSDFFPVPVPFARAGTATRYNSDGLPEELAADMPRLSYDPVSLACLGYLIEKGGTNYVQRSESAVNGASPWGNYAMSGCTLAVSSLFGFAKQYSITEDSSTGAHTVLSGTGAVTHTSIARQTISFHAKANGRHLLRLSFFNDDKTIDVAAGTATGSNIHIQAMPNGWYRITCTKVLNATTLNWNLSMLDNSGNASYTGDNASGVLVRMLQVEKGNVATSYMPSYGTAATRVADQISFGQAQQNGYCNTGAATVYTAYKAFYANQLLTETGMAYIPDASLSIGSTPDTLLASFSNPNTLTADTALQLAGQYTASTMKEYKNGVNTVSTSYTTATDLTGFYVYGDQYPMLLQCIAIFKDPLLNAELIAITS